MKRVLDNNLLRNFIIIKMSLNNYNGLLDLKKHIKKYALTKN